ncbi:ribonuclease Trv [Hypoxylon argillaceum]|nr:ribonuclease Trv [Hypoxylon argillaceum]
MAPTISLRSLLTYANNFVSQVPLLGSISNNIPNSLLSVFDPSHSSSSSQPPAANLPYETDYDEQRILDGITPYDPFLSAPSCPLDGPISCNNQSATDSCCFIHPGGRLLLTQFWDEEVHVGGGEEDWTLHGLWPDLCDGSYDQFCGMTPRFNNITDVLKHYDQGELVESMNRYWIASYGTNEHLWAHEYNKHGTCINTLAPSCYGEAYTPGVEVVDYFVRAFGLFQMLDTYRALERVGIEPHPSKTYALADVEAALEEFSGSRVILKCSRRGVLHEAWYVWFVKGSLQSGQLVPARDSFKGDHSNCPAQVRYLPKRDRRRK